MRTIIVITVVVMFTITVTCTFSQAEDPEITYRFSGQALIGGEPAPKGTIISATVGDELVGTTTVNDSEGRWSMEINAWHLRNGVCEAVFLVAGKPAGKQTVNCQVDVLLETGSGAAEAPTPTSRDPGDDQDNDDGGEVESTVEDDDDTPTITVEVTAQETAENNETEESDEATEGAETVVQPRTPRTGTGGIDRSSPWPAVLGTLAVALLGILSLIKPIRSTRQRRP